jgi:hypothetical protein
MCCSFDLDFHQQDHMSRYDTCITSATGQLRYVSSVENIRFGNYFFIYKLLADITKGLFGKYPVMVIFEGDVFTETGVTDYQVGTYGTVLESGTRIDRLDKSFPTIPHHPYDYVR